MTGNEFQEQLKRLEKRFKKEYPLDQVKLMWGRLKYFPYAALIMATDNMICEDKYFPGFNEIRDHLKRVMGANAKLKMENEHLKKGFQVACNFCQDTGIRLRSCRKDLVRDFYCSCKAGQEIGPKHDFSIEPWRSMVLRSSSLTGSALTRQLKQIMRQSFQKATRKVPKDEEKQTDKGVRYPKSDPGLSDGLEDLPF